MLFSISSYYATAALLVTSLQYLHEASAFSLTQQHLSCHNQIIKLQNHKSHTILFATSNEESNEKSSAAATSTTNTSKSARERGIYARPSAAIERGSGFFIPGLEGPRIRILFGITVLIADWANHTFAESQVGDYGQIIAEVLAAFYGALLLLQGLIESGVGEVGSRGDNNNNLVIEGNGDGLDNNDIDNSMKGTISSSGISTIIQGNESTLKSMQRLARTIVNLTPATHFILANEEDGVLYRYGIWVDDGNRPGDNNTEEDRSIIKLALDAAGSSRAGRVALPSDHPTSKLLPTSATRCILVQSIVDGYGSDNGGKSCLIIGSDKLLPAYTKNDLRWIGQLALQQA